MKELLRMHRHRAFFFGTAMALVLGFMANQAQAATVTITVDLGGVPIYSTTGAVNITALNTDLANAGSAYRFQPNGLTATATGDAVSAGLSTAGTVTVVSTGSTADKLSVDVVETGILSPTGPASLGGSASDTYTQVPSGSTSFYGDFNTTTVTPTFILAASGTNGGGTTFPPQDIGTVSSGYSLSNHFIIDLSPGTAATHGTDSFSGGVVLTTGTVPEPASVVMLLTGMPLPLAIVFGLIRRRRAEA